ncbi:MAG: helix-turn-helix domain-containing protein [Chloroflexota bacterium]
MKSYGQYCPIAQALELLGDRWTLLIIRDMLTGTRHFNDLARGLPNISRALLAKRLRQLETSEIIIKHYPDEGRKTTEYHLTQSGQQLQEIINSLLIWGANWAFGEPTLDQLDPVLLMWWMQDRVNMAYIPQERLVIQFDFFGDKNETLWLLITKPDVTICLTDPGYEINVLVKADLRTYFKLWLGKLDYPDVIDTPHLSIEAIPQHIRDFPNWFAWSLAAPAVRSAEVAKRKIL